jgi:propionyl-CoA carboxylase alpha chain
MFSKILIANRGEIACRVIRTCQRLGIKTVAVYSEADDGAMHMRMADEAFLIGAAPAAQSYLKIDKIVEVAKSCGAQAVHPGYGFLSENAKFAKALAAAGIVFIGPNMSAVAAMGDKIESKKLAEKAKVSSVPGYLAPIKDAAEAVTIADEIGYPVMVKASAGGGGKGMRIANSAAEIKDAFRSATSEARASFGDDRVFIEKFITEPRHIEIQVLGDRHGNVVYLGERECSIQRRHQKVIEEAPSPFLDDKIRAAMGKQAVALAKAVGYDSAGTVEFIVDDHRKFYFLEMNTRLQVEHPITELVTGIDIVEQMIRVAAGEKLGFTQSDIKPRGWAIEARIYAEDPLRGFLPSIGRLTLWRPPLDMPDVRVDTGVQEGSEISVYYDPMIAKLCSFGESRDAAIERMRMALDETRLAGIGHNVGFLAAVVAHPRFKAGRLTTNFIADEWPNGFSGADLEPAQRDGLASVAVSIHLQTMSREMAGAGRIPYRRNGDEAAWVVAFGDQVVQVATSQAKDGVKFTVGKKSYFLQSDWQPGQPLWRGAVNSEAVSVQIARMADGYRLSHGGAVLNVTVRRQAVADLARFMPKKVALDLSKFLLSPMPGLVVSIDVKKGEPVKSGQTLAVVEAMKMENILRAERDGVIDTISAKPGDRLAVDQVILEFE